MIDTIEMFLDVTYGYSIRISFTIQSIGSKGLYLQLPQSCPKLKLCGNIELIYNQPDDDHIIIKKIRKLAIITLLNSNTIEIKPKEYQDIHTMVPIQFSYAQGDYPLITVYNSDGIPLLPIVIDLPKNEN